MKFGLPVAAGKFVTSIASVITLALLAHRLGPGPFGVIAVIRALVTIVDQYTNFNTWQVIVKYGTEATAQERPSDVERLIKLSLIVDASTGALAAAVIVGLAFLIPSSFGWTPHESALCALYSLTVVARAPGASDGIFRICDAYRDFAVATTISAVMMTATIAIAVALGASLDGCVMALILGEVLGNALVAAVSLRTAKKFGYGGWPRAKLKGIRSTFPGIVHFMVATNAQLTVKKSHGELDTVVVGAMLGKVPSGLFRVVKQLGTIPGRVFLPFEQVLFTELARATAAGEYREFRRLLRRFAAVVGLGSLVIWAIAAVTAEPVIRMIAGTDFVAAAPAFRWYLLAMVLAVANAPVQRALIALGRPGTLFFFDLATLVVLIAAAIVGAEYWGIVGVSVAVVLQRLIQMVWSTWLVARVVRERERDRPHDDVALPAAR